jgi:hypothetical protein
MPGRRINLEYITPIYDTIAITNDFAIVIIIKPIRGDEPR